MNQEIGKHAIVLLGVGHTNAHILKMWRMHRIENARLICISNFPVATYSGMLPGVLAGQYSVEQMEIDLVRLCAVSGARLIQDEVTGINREQQQILFKNRAPLQYDLLSIGMGSVPTVDGVEIQSSEQMVRIKPMQTFLDRLHKRIRQVLESGKNKIQINVVGGGIGGTEITFCLRHRLAREWPDTDFSIRLINGSDALVGGSIQQTEKNVRRELEKAGTDVKTGNRVTRIEAEQILLDDGTVLESDIVFWATSAIAPPLLANLNLEKDKKGFLLTRDTLQTLTDDRIFAVGDSGTLSENPTPKAGVYAVRQGPVLWDNIQRSLKSESLRSYEPQRSFLKLINLGNGKAIAEYWGRSFVGGWCWKWKDRIDTRFMAMYQDYDLREMSASTSDTKSKMRCVGCGGKVSGASLESALAQIQFENNEQVVVGVQHPDDAAIVRVPDSEVTVTTDFFASPFDDPFLFGQISALNGSSDCYAMGAQPFATLAMAQVPFGHPRAQREYLVEMMAGAAKEFNRMKTSIVGGHSIEGPRMAMGFTVMANQATQPLLKSNLKIGDRLIVTKPLGTGTLLAALMEGKCHGNWYNEMIQSMLQCNSIAIELAETFSVRALTDVTGFGLAGHLNELLVASKKRAEIEIGSVNLLDGFEALTKLGVESTMTIENRSVESNMHAAPEIQKTAAYQSLFDPQTCGGLLIAVAEKDADAVCRWLTDQGLERNFAIGSVVGESGQENEGPGIQVSN